VIALARHSRKELAADADADVLAGRLTVATEEFVLLSRREAQDSPGVDAKRAREAGRQARALLAALGLRDDHEQPSPEVVYAVFREQSAEDELARRHLSAMLYHLNIRWFGEDPAHMPRPPGQGAFRAAVEGGAPHRAPDGARCAGLRCECRGEGGERGPLAGVPALQCSLRVSALCAIYTTAFGGPPSYSAKGTTPTGDIPGVRFSREVIRLILERHDTVDPELDSRLLERLATLTRSPQAVRERIREARRGGSHRKR